VLVFPAICFAVNFISHQNALDKVGTTFDKQNYVAFLVRSFLYPFIAPLFTHLTETLAFSGVIGLMYVVTRNYRNKTVKGLSLLQFIFIGTVLANMLVFWRTRPFLSEFLSNFGSSFPDRYYLGMNILGVAALLSFFEEDILKIRNRMKTLPSVMAATLITIIFASNAFYDIYQQRISFREWPTISESVKQDFCLNTNLTFTVPPYAPDSGWFVTIPKGMIAKFAKENC
jgi:hypothetical protein